VVGTSETSSRSATSSAKVGWARPENSMRFFDDVRCSRLSTGVVVLRFRVTGIGGIGRGVCRRGSWPLTSHPSLHDSLLSVGYRQRPGRHVVSYRGSGAGVRAVTDSHGRHKHVIGSGARVASDLCARFGDAVEISHDGAGPDI